MAFVRSIGNLSMDATVIESCLQPIRDALTYAGFSDLTATISGSSDKRIDIHTGSSATNSTIFLSIYNIGGDGFITARANDSVATTAVGWGLNIKIVATQSGIALLSAVGTAYSNGAGVITTDNNNDYVVIVSSASSSMANPYVVARTSEYTAPVQYNASTSTAFGCTALSIVPEPSYDGSAKYIPDFMFAHATQYTVDGEVVLNGVKYYTIGGSWFMSEGEVS